MRKTLNFIPAIFVLGTLLSLGLFGQSKLPSSPIKTIYVIPSSHYDFGFVEQPSAIRERAARHIDEVIRVAEADKDFRWTIESVWQVNEWLKRQKKPSSVLPQDKAKIARLMNLIKSGQIVLSTAWGSMHTDYMGAEELNRINYDFVALQRQYGISSEVAYMNDVPGHPMPVASMLASAGTKYMVTGANTFINSATDLAPGKVPFYWEAPDGNKVLLWISQGNRGAYVEAFTQYYLDPYSLDPYTDRKPFDMFNPEMAGKKSDIEMMEVGVTDLLNNYNKGGYKYDAVMAMYAHDFFEPENVLNLERAVKMWNSKHDEVKLKIATSPDFFKYIERKYGSQIPTYRGEWSGLWSEAKTASPRISATGRYTHDHAPAAETLWSAIAMTRRLPVPVGNFAEIYDLMFTYDEHSGAGNTGWPQLNSSDPLRKQNAEYVEFTRAAKDETDELLKTGIGILANPTRFENRSPAVNGATHPVIIYNGLSWERDDVVRLPPPSDGERILAIRDAAGQGVAFDIDESGNAVFVAKRVPPMGYATYEVSTSLVKTATTLRHFDGTQAENSRFAIRLNRDGTIASIRDKTTNRELTSATGEMAFNDLLRLEGPDPSRVSYPVQTVTTVSRGGRGMTQLRIHRAQSLFPLTTVTIYNDLDRVEIHNELDPTKFPFTGGNNNWHDSYYFAFPFNISKNGLKIMRGGQRWFDRLPDDYLPGARRDSVSTQHLIGLTDGRASALIAHRQAFHWVYSGFISTKVKPQNAPAGFPLMYTGKFPLPEATLYSRAIRFGVQADTHDLGIINIPTVEPGRDDLMIFDYAIAGDGAFDPIRAWRMGSEFNLPLRAEYVGIAPAEKSVGFFSVDAPNVEIVTVKSITESASRGEVTSAPLSPKVNKVFIVRLQEFAGRPANATIKLPGKVVSASLMNITESVELGKIATTSPLRVSLRPYECATVRVEIE
ncbi:MAG TPA: glycosyl hydrolase-related protein [Pyrinomonadaceae bacterium]|nr:glycosyl hydrolase-related protein [Pyrinomonadaceae bacterium]